MAKAELVKESITYVPGDGDPASVKWGGHTFQANIAKEIEGHPEGSAREQLNHALIESARNNPCFRLGSEKAPRKAKNALPKTADEYKAYIVRWMQDPSIQSASDLIGRFAKDRELQAACEVGADDFAWIGTLFMPKLSDLAKADELSNEQVAAIWLQHGINQLPW